MKQFLLLIGIFFQFSLYAQKKEDINYRYKAIQGIGYLHTQVSMIINHWEFYPLNIDASDACEQQFQKHFKEELEHDEEWAEYMMVENNLLDHYDELGKKVVEDIEFNLKFYHETIALLKDPEDFTNQLDELKKELKKAEEKLLQSIYPALCKKN